MDDEAYFFEDFGPLEYFTCKRCEWDFDSVTIIDGLCAECDMLPEKPTCAECDTEVQELATLINGLCGHCHAEMIGG